jgi:hypothetical protein
MGPAYKSQNNNASKPLSNCAHSPYKDQNEKARITEGRAKNQRENVQIPIR